MRRVNAVVARERQAVDDLGIAVDEARPGASGFAIMTPPSLLVGALSSASQRPSAASHAMSASSRKRCPGDIPRHEARE
jgi:hypothetical protein